MSNDSGAPVAPVVTAPVVTAPTTPAAPADGKPVVPATPADQVAAPAAPAAPLTLNLEPTITPVVPPLVGEKTGDAIVYDTTGNPKLDISLGFLGKLGIAPDHPGMVAAAAGDFSILKAHLSTLGAKAQGWEANIALGESAYADTKTSNEARATKDRDAIYGAVGGKDQWDSIVSFARSATEDSPEQRTEVNRVLAAGGLGAVAMAQYLAGLANKANAPKEPAAITGGNPASVTAPAVTAYALSPRQYTAEVSKLHATLRASGKGGVDGNPAYIELGRRRAAWRETR